MGEAQATLWALHWGQYFWSEVVHVGRSVFVLWVSTGEELELFAMVKGTPNRIGRITATLDCVKILIWSPDLCAER